jgi:hypothetical protein
MTVVRVSLEVIADTQLGNWGYQTVVCPRINLLFFVAQFTRVSSPAKLNFPCEASIVSHFPLIPFVSAHDFQTSPELYTCSQESLVQSRL